MELLGVPSGLAGTFPFLRPRRCCCFASEKPHARFILRSRRLSASPPPSPSRPQLDPSSKHIPKAQSAPDGSADDSDDYSPPPAAKKDVSRRNPFQSPRSEAKEKEDVEQLDTQLSEGEKPPYIEYLMDLGLNHEDIRRIVQINPYIQYRSVVEQIRPVIELLLNLGVDHSSLPRILRACPQVEGVSIEKETIMGNIAYFESLGMDKAQCVKALSRSPQLLTLDREKIQTIVAYFLNLGVSAENIGKMIVQFPHLFGMSVEEKIKPTMDFFLDRGFTMEELKLIVVRFAPINGLSLTESLIPKWEFFLEMEYPKSWLVSFPQYFGYSLEDRIKPRLKFAKEHGLQFHLSNLLSPTNSAFEMRMKKWVSRSVKDGGECSA